MTDESEVFDSQKPLTVNGNNQIKGLYLVMSGQNTKSTKPQLNLSFVGIYTNLNSFYIRIF